MATLGLRVPPPQWWESRRSPTCSRSRSGTCGARGSFLRSGQASRCPQPLCGADDDLAANVASFAELPYGGEYEIVLGVRSPEDPAWPIAEEAVRRWPHRMRLVRQERRWASTRR